MVLGGLRYSWRPCELANPTRPGRIYARRYDATGRHHCGHGCHPRETVQKIAHRSQDAPKIHLAQMMSHPKGGCCHLFRQSANQNLENQPQPQGTSSESQDRAPALGQPSQYLGER